MISSFTCIPAADVSSLSTSDIAALLAEWDAMKANVFCIAMGNEPALYDTYNGGNTFADYPGKLAMVYEYMATQSGWEHVTVSIPFSLSIAGPMYPVASSTFKSEYASYLSPIVSTLRSYGGPFSINLYPFFTAMDDPSLLSYCLGDEAAGEYGSMLEAQYAGVGYALDALFPGHGLELIVTETGWASYSSAFYGATPANAQTYIANMLSAMQSPTSQIYEAKIFLFELFDEELKGGGDHEQHFGVYANDGSAKYSQTALSLLSEGALTFDDDETEDDGGAEGDVLSVAVPVIVAVLACCLLVGALGFLYRARREKGVVAFDEENDEHATNEMTQSTDGNGQTREEEQAIEIDAEVSE